MTFNIWLLVLIIPAALLLFQLPAALGKVRGLIAGVAVLLLFVGLAFVFEERIWVAADSAIDSIHAAANSETCFKCHEDHYRTWHRTYHRTMTRDAKPEYVKGDFNNVSYVFQGVPTHLTRNGAEFFMETLDQDAVNQWTQAAVLARAKKVALPPPPLRKYQVDRLVGSHWFQEYMTRDQHGRFWRLPVSYHLVEKRWIHTNGAFLAPDTDDFWSKSSVWNDTCVFCHNTKPSKRPLRQPWDESRLLGYDTEVRELGIACEACHGPGAAHIRVNQNLARRYAVHPDGDATIVNPRRLSAKRSDDICAHCHGALVPKAQTWDPATITDPYDAGNDLLRFNDFFWSEAQQMQLHQRQGKLHPRALPGAVPMTEAPAGSMPAPNPRDGDGRFWGDGTPLTTALEYQGMALSACYQKGEGKLSCLSCHSLHDSEPNFLLRRSMESNEACYQCHDGYRQRLTEHTHHAGGSAGSLCYNCHMPYSVYSLLTTHRSHRIEALRVADSLGTGKPHACNLCHLDKSLGWTQDRLHAWYGRHPQALPEDEGKFSSALLHLSRSDARSRAIVAGAFSWSAAQAASGTDWMGLMLTRLLEPERYPAVRYLAYRGLRSINARAAGDYDYLADPALRSAQLKAMRGRFAANATAPGKRYPYLPLDERGQPRNTVLEQLLQKRNDPDVSVHE
jgi:predicted CXXCH cytochrome family protein